MQWRFLSFPGISLTKLAGFKRFMSNICCGTHELAMFIVRLTITSAIKQAICSLIVDDWKRCLLFDAGPEDSVFEANTNRILFSHGRVSTHCVVTLA